jgi:hypothetical protein
MSTIQIPINQYKHSRLNQFPATRLINVFTFHARGVDLDSPQRGEITRKTPFLFFIIFGILNIENRLKKI